MTRPSPVPEQSTVALHGAWTRLVGDAVIDTVAVPGTFPPLGACTLAYDFPWGAVAPGRRYYLRTEGVLAWATFQLNGHTLGTAGPWSRHRFEIPQALLRSTNQLRCELSDISQSFGPTPGRRFDAGLFRPIAIESRPDTFLADWRLRYALTPDDQLVTAHVQVELDGPAPGPCTAVVRERTSGRIVAQATAPAGTEIALTLAQPRLWSPGVPFLYTMSVSHGEETIIEEIGFRRLESRGRDLWLNGERLLLKGVCRHEFMSGFGYAPPEAEVRRELAQIRHAGFNHIRLVHSPQAPCVPRLAAEIGLLVTEEPGTCFHDLADPAVAEPAIAALRNLIIRDRNLPSILAWYIYNECNPNTAYAVRAAGIARALNPGCLLAMADCSGRVEEIKAMVAAADLSFYGINSYTYSGPDYQKIMDTYTDRPLVFTEWGGCMAQGNRRVLDWHCRIFAAAAAEASPRRIAGCSFWAWADYEEYSRAEFAAIDGWTVEGLVDQRRQPKPDLALMSQWCFEMDHPSPRPTARAEILLAMPPRPGAYHCVDVSQVAGDQAAAEAAFALARNPAIRVNYSNGLDPVLSHLPSLQRIQVAGLPFACRGGAGPASPLLLAGSRPEAVIPVGRLVRGVSILGHTAYHAAYPANDVSSVHHRDAETVRAYGDAAGFYDFVFDDGIETIALRHGVHVLRGNDICRWWLTAPRGPETAPAVRAVVHPSYEVLRIDLWERRWDRPRRLTEIRWRLTDQAALLTLYALTTHDA